MPTVQSTVGDVAIVGSLSVSGTITGQSRAGLTAETDQVYGLNLQNFRVWDAFQTALGTAASDDLGITAGTWATAVPYITTGDVKALGTTTRRARTTFVLPAEYTAGADVSIRTTAGMVTTVADTSAVIDFEVFKSGRTGAGFAITGSDLVTTTATTINSTTPSNKTFELNASGLAPGDALDIRMTITVVDAATVTAVIGATAHVEFLLDIKG